MRALRRSFVSAVIAVAVVVTAALPSLGAARRGAGSTQAGHAPPPVAFVRLPSSIAALGDSITQAFDATPTVHILVNQPQYSWSTGYSGGMASQYERLLAAGDIAIKNHYHDDAVTGAKMDQMVAQAAKAVSERAAYVTVLLGANDLCTRSVSAMTPVGTFRREFSAGMQELEKMKGTRIFVSSIPNLYHLWQIFHTSSTAEGRWAFGICQSMLSTRDTRSDRLAVAARERADNAVLSSVCRSYRNCRFDDLAVFHANFTRSDVSTIDYFHPSILGQKVLAATAWKASYWPKLP